MLIPCDERRLGGESSSPFPMLPQGKHYIHPYPRRTRIFSEQRTPDAVTHKWINVGLAAGMMRRREARSHRRARVVARNKNFCNGPEYT